MANLITQLEIRNRLQFDYNRGVLSESKDRRKYNIEQFNAIPRGSLAYEIEEKRVLLYTTIEGEKIYIQFPGKESVRDIPYPYDLRPELCLEDGTFIAPASFTHIWDTMDYIAKTHNAYLYIIATIFLKIGYMHGYIKTSGSYYSELVSKTSIKRDKDVELDWYSLGIDEDIWYTLNDGIGKVPFSNAEVTIEALFKYIDLLFQNEDCKYYYQNVFIKKISSYGLTSGRNSSSDTVLSVISYLKGDTLMSQLINGVSKGRGIVSFKKSNYETITNGLVKNK